MWAFGGRISIFEDGLWQKNCYRLVIRIYYALHIVHHRLQWPQRNQDGSIIFPPTIRKVPQNEPVYPKTIQMKYETNRARTVLHLAICLLAVFIPRSRIVGRRHAACAGGISADALTHLFGSRLLCATIYEISDHVKQACHSVAGRPSPTKFGIHA